MERGSLGADGTCCGCPPTIGLACRLLLRSQDAPWGLGVTMEGSWWCASHRMGRREWTSIGSRRRRKSCRQLGDWAAVLGKREWTDGRSVRGCAADDTLIVTYAIELQVIFCHRVYSLCSQCMYIWKFSHPPSPNPSSLLYTPLARRPNVPEEDCD